MAEKALAASRANRTATRDIGRLDTSARREWARERLDEALRTYRTDLGSPALLERLEEAIVFERQLHDMDEVNGDG